MSTIDNKKKKKNNEEHHIHRISRLIPGRPTRLCMVVLCGLVGLGGVGGGVWLGGFGGGFGWGCVWGGFCLWCLGWGGWGRSVFFSTIIRDLSEKTKTYLRRKGKSDGKERDINNAKNLGKITNHIQENKRERGGGPPCQRRNVDASQTQR